MVGELCKSKKNKIKKTQRIHELFLSLCTSNKEMKKKKEKKRMKNGKKKINKERKKIKRS